MRALQPNPNPASPRDPPAPLPLAYPPNGPASLSGSMTPTPPPPAGSVTPEGYPTFPLTSHCELGASGQITCGGSAQHTAMALEAHTQTQP